MKTTFVRRGRTIYRAALSVFLAASLIGVAGAQAKPNVLMVISDDLNSMISPLGDPNAVTPNLERLHTRAVLFENAICQFPFCSPSRASIFTGLYPWAHGNVGGGAPYPNHLQVFPDRIGMPEYFRNHGYWTASYGKTEHHIQERNWDVQTTDYRRGAWVPDYDGSTLVHEDTILARGITGSPHVKVYDLPPESFVDGVSTTAALADLESHLSAPDPAPFFAVVGFHTPHDPWDVPQSIFDQYDPASLTLNPNPRGNWPGWAWKINNKNLEPITDDRRRDLLRAYLSAVTLMDYQLGRILDFLDAEALWDDTIVVFLSDNGYSLCEHEAMYAKRNITRENLRVPMMIHLPGNVHAGARCSRQVELQGIFPTLIELCELPPYPGYLDGRSLEPLLLDPNRDWPYAAKSVLATPNKTSPVAKVVQLEALKIAQGTDTARDMYFDHAADPQELGPDWHPADAPPSDARWAPLLYSLREDFGFEVGQSSVFYKKHSENSPDRDLDGIADSTEIALRILGFREWINEEDRWNSLLRGASIVPKHDEFGQLEWEIAFPEFSISRPPGQASTSPPFELQESIDLELWRPSDASYVESPEGSFYWQDEMTPPAKFYRVKLPRSSE